jgi:polyhydroxybutyrate depolymerase
MKVQRKLVLAVLLGLALIFVFQLCGHNAFANGPFRDRLRERIKDRIIQRLEEQPAPVANATVEQKLTVGDYTFVIPFEGLTRLYMVHVPKSYNPATPTPLVMAFHGGGGDMEIQANDRYYGLISKSEQAGFIAVFPNGYSLFRSGKLATWNAGACCGSARDKNIDDVGFVRQIIHNLENQLSIDRSKIFATGMSNGGLMAHRLACEMADTFAAIGPVAGTDNTLQCRPSRPISVIEIHAKNDDHILFNGGIGQAFSEERKEKICDFTSVPETISRWVKRDRCNSTPARVLDKPGAYCDLYSPCAGNAQVELCVTATGGHSWPGGVKPRGKGTPSNAINADDVIWNFFKTK